MSVPSPPWRLYGWAGLLVNRTPITDVLPGLLPPEFQVTPFFRDKTLSGHYLGSYVPVEGSTFGQPFHEFGYNACLARYGDHSGFYVSAMAVDHPGAFEGGRRFWGVPKSEGCFEQVGEFGYEVKSHEGRVEAALEFRKVLSLGYWRRTFEFLSVLDDRILLFKIQYHGELFLCKAKRYRIQTKGKVHAVLFDKCWITIEAPQVVGSRERLTV